MKNLLKQYINWQTNGLAITLTSGTILYVVALLIITHVSAAQLTTTPRNIAPSDVSRTTDQVLAADTSMTLAPITKYVNGVKTEGCFDTGSGFVLIQDFLGRGEWASFGTKTCSSDNETTLSEMIRGLNPNIASFGTGTGLDFDAGAQVRVIDYTVISKTTFYTDLNNVCTAQGCLSFFGSGSFQNPTFATEALRDHQLGATTEGLTACVTGTGQCYDLIGGTWRSHSGSNVINASLTVAGKVQVASTGAIFAGTATGSTGAFNAITAGNATASGGLTVAQAGYVVVLNSSGFLDPTTLGQTNGGDTTLFFRADGSFTDPLAGAALTNATNSGTIVTDNYTSGSGITFKTSGSPILTLTSSGHLITNGGTPTTGYCGTSSNTVTGTDFAGKVLTSGGSSTQCNVYFAQPYKNASCIVNSTNVSFTALAVSYTSTGFIVTGAGGNFGAQTLSYICIGI